MYQLIKANIYYSFQTKFNIAFQILGFTYISFVSFIFAPKYCALNGTQELTEMPLTLFLFVITFLFVCATLTRGKYAQVSFSQLILSFPVKKIDLLNSHFLKLIGLKLVVLVDVLLFSWISLMIHGLTINEFYLQILGISIVYSVGVTGSLFILLYFITQWFDILIYVLYFAIFISLTQPFHFFWLASMNNPGLFISGGIVLIILAYIISVICIYRRDF